MSVEVVDEDMVSHPQSTIHVRRNPSQSSLHPKRPLPKVCASLPVFSPTPPSPQVPREEENHQQKRAQGEPFKAWLAAKTKAHEKAQLQAKQHAEELKRLEERKEQRKREVLQLWTERYEDKLREQKSNEEHMQRLERIRVEAERLAAKKREEMCREEYQRWVRDKAKQRESAYTGPVRYVKKAKTERARPTLTITISSPATEPRLSLSTFQVSIPPTTLGRPKRS